MTEVNPFHQTLLSKLWILYQLLLNILLENIRRIGMNAICLQVPSFQNTEPDTNKNLEPTSADEPTKTIERPLIEEIVSQDELEMSQKLEDETPFIQIKRRKRSTDETSHRTNKLKTPTFIKKLRKKAKTRRKMATIQHLKKTIRLLKSTEDFRLLHRNRPSRNLSDIIRF